MTDNKINTTTAPFEGMTASEILTTLDKDSTANTIETALNAVKDKLADSNKTARENRISELFELVTNDGDKTRFFVEYLASPYYTAQTIAGPDSEGQYSMKPAARFLDYCALEKAYRKRMDKKGTLYASPDYADRMTALIKALFAYKSKDVGAVDGKTAPSITALQNAAQNAASRSASSPRMP